MEQPPTAQFVETRNLSLTHVEEEMSARVTSYLEDFPQKLGEAEDAPATMRALPG